MVLELFQKCGFDEKEVGLLTQSYLAFVGVDSYDQDRIARAVNGEIVSKSDSLNPEAYTTVTDPLSTSGKELIAKKRMMIRQRARRQREKDIADQRFLLHKVSKRGSRLVQKFPDIGETIENFVQDHKVGAGVLTF